MSIDGIDTVGAGKHVGEAKKTVSERSADKADFGRLLERELKNQDTEAVAARSTPPIFATFPVYELADLDGLPDSIDLREKGIKDTEQLIDILDKYRQGLNREVLNPENMKETVLVLDQVSKGMMEYINQVEHHDLLELMRDSLIMARVEVEKYSRGDYS